MSTLLERTVGAVVDMRAYATGTASSKDWLDGRAVPAFADDKAIVSAFAPRGRGHVERLPTDEMVLVLNGSLDIESDAGMLTIGQDKCVVLPIFSNFRWRASDDLLAIVYAAPTDAQGTASTPLLIDESAQLSPSAAPAAKNLIGATPSCRSHNDYVSANREFACGTWDSTPYHRKQIPYRQVELMFLLEGAVTFTAGNDSVSFEKGDVCLFVRGDGCAWLSEVHVKKVYATQRPVA